MAKYTSYATAVKWSDSNLVLCNNIAEIDSSIYENMRKPLYNEETETHTEIFQFYITGLSEESVQYQESNFDLIYSYSELLDCYVLCVDNFGTSWKSVACEVYSERWIEFNEDLLINGH